MTTGGADQGSDRFWSRLSCRFSSGVIVRSPVPQPAPGAVRLKPEAPVKVPVVGLGALFVDPPGQVKDREVHPVPEGLVDIDQVPVIFLGDGGEGGDHGQIGAPGLPGPAHRGQGLVDVGEVVRAPRRRARPVVRLGGVAVNGDLQEKHRRGRQFARPWPPPGCRWWRWRWGAPAWRRPR